MMKIVVHVMDGLAVRALPGMTVRRTFRTAVQRILYADDRVEETEIAVEPYQAEVRLGSLGGLSAEDMADMELAEAEPFETPAGKQPIGQERFEPEGETWRQAFDVEDEPPPPPEQTPAEKLSKRTGMTIAEIRAALDIAPDGKADAAVR